MPLSKAKDRERKRLFRLESKNIQPKVVPLYNPAVHRAGDRVLVYQGKRLIEMVIPRLDADGNPIPD